MQGGSNPQFTPVPVWYDRNPVRKGFKVEASNMAPHGLTLQGSYTVPVGKKAILSSAQVTAYRTTAATTAGMISLYVVDAFDIDPEYFILRALFNLPLVGDSYNESIGLFLLLTAGDIISLKSFDLSEGGLLFINMTCSITEFDA